MYFNILRRIFTGIFLALAVSSCHYLVADFKHEPGTFFPHQFHTGEPDSIKNSNCLDCHKGKDKDKDSYSWDIPTKKVCLDCHDAEDSTTKKVSLRPRTDSLIHFDHKWHVKGDPELNCMDCHKKVVTDSYLPVRGGYPKHENCETCHGDWLPSTTDSDNVLKGNCKKCHKEKIMPRDHYENWMEMHGTLAIGKWETDCVSCHSDKNNCTQCHAGGFFRPVSHDLAWERTHRFNVRNDIQNCRSCHSDDSCQDCHRSHGVSGSIDYRTRMDTIIHPPGWLSDVPETGNHHSVKARMELDTCKACHVANDCRGCHFKRFPYGR